MHVEKHPQAGQTVTWDLTTAPHPQMPGVEITDFRIEDWWDHMTGGSWRDAGGNFAAMYYALRTGMGGLPIDDEVVYGKTPNGFGHLVHISEISLKES